MLTIETRINGTLTSHMTLIRKEPRRKGKLHYNVTYTKLDTSPPTCIQFKVLHEYKDGSETLVQLAFTRLARELRNTKKD